ncbi:hypothetical protein BJV74DRAFT_867441 [Russula compacta]|nr:hypothetical protein BJV74DRAFT_867441 [Russula compacta]
MPPATSAYHRLQRHQHHPQIPAAPRGFGKRSQPRQLTMSMQSHLPPPPVLTYGLATWFDL